jgi:phospholipase C
MPCVQSGRQSLKRAASRAIIGAMIAQLLSCTTPSFAHEKETVSPIKHVIIIIGENRTFDQIFAT